MGVKKDLKNIGKLRVKCFANAMQPLLREVTILRVVRKLKEHEVQMKGG